MGDALKGKLTVAPDISLNVELNEGHLVDMQVSLTEEQLHVAEKSLIKELDVLSKESNELHTKRATVIDTAANKQEKSVATTVTPVLKKIGATKVETEVTWSEAEAGRKIDVKIIVSPESRKKNNSIAGNLNFYKRIGMPAEVKKIDARRKDLDKEINEVRKKLTQVKTDLSNIPRIERQARAKLAMETLKSTPAGRKLADNLNKQALLPPPK